MTNRYPEPTSTQADGRIVYPVPVGKCRHPSAVREGPRLRCPDCGAWLLGPMGSRLPVMAGGSGTPPCGHPTTRHFCLCYCEMCNASAAESARIVEERSNARRVSLARSGDAIPDPHEHLHADPSADEPQPAPIAGSAGEPPTDWEALAETWAAKCANTQALLVAASIREAGYRAALERIAGGVDHPAGIMAVPEWYAAIQWSQLIAREALGYDPTTGMGEPKSTPQGTPA